MRKIKKGMYVTITKWLSTGDRSYVGDVLLVKEVVGPIVLVENLTLPRIYTRRQFALSQDHVTFIELTRSYVNSRRLEAQDE